MKACPASVSSRRALFAVIAGSGMDGLGDGMTVDDVVPFDAIDGVGPCTVEGHRGEVRFCRLQEVPCVVVSGRRHGYEGAPQDMHRLIGWLKQNGVARLLVTSAAGGLRREQGPGELVVVHDMIDMQNRDRSFASGRNGPRGGLTIDAALASKVEVAAGRAGLRWSRGTLACGVGPTYETHAEVHMLQLLGADLVTMSSAPEVHAANHHDVPVAAVATITNPATGIMGSIPGHDEVIVAAEGAMTGLRRLIQQLIVK